MLVESVELCPNHQNPYNEFALVKPLILGGVDGQQNDESVE